MVSHIRMHCGTEAHRLRMVFAAKGGTSMAQPKHKKWLLGVLVIALAMPVAVFAQGFQTGTLSAIVKDQTGAALPGVTVTVTSEERGTQRTAVTESNGVATF